MSIQYKDLREWLELVDKEGELRKVEGASWEEDIGMANEMLSLNPGSPAVIFDKINGYPQGYRVLGNVLSDKRIAMTFGLPTNLQRFELSTALHKKTQENKPIPPIYVSDGPVMENVIEGDDINVLKFPVPKWHEGDGGRYIGTGSIDITKDPDEDWINAGTYRVMVSDEKHVGFYISPGKHGRIHRDKYFSRKEPCPVVIVVGNEPLLIMAGSIEIPRGLSEFDWAGGIRGQAYEVIKGKYTGLPIPANAEIALEGFAYPDDLAPEGPFGEWTGYYASAAHMESRIEIKAIYHRNDPIILGFVPYHPPDGQALFRTFLRSPLIKEEMEKAGVPDVVATWAHEAGGARLFTAVSIKQRYPGHATQAGHIAAQCRAGAYCGRYVVVVDDDIDVTNLDEVIWAMCTRSDPATSIDIIKRAWSSRLDPRIPPKEKEIGALFNSRAIIDATRPYEWKDEFPLVNMSSLETRKKAMEKWGYLLK